MKKAFLEISLEFMRNMKQEDLGQVLLNSKMTLVYMYECFSFSNHNLSIFVMRFCPFCGNILYDLSSLL